MLDFRSNWQPEKTDPCHIPIAFMCFLVTTSIKLLLLCIRQYLNIKIHFQLHSLFCIILYIGGKQFRCSVFTFVQYIYYYLMMPLLNNQVQIDFQSSLNFNF